MQLQRGVTGFRHVRDPGLSETDRKSFRAHCHTIVQALGGRVQPAVSRNDDIARNFVFESVELPRQNVAVLLNQHFPIVAFANSPIESVIPPLQFADCSDLADAFKAFGAYVVLSKAELEKPLSKADLSQLASAEIEQVKYWRPICVGDVLFNFWD